MISFDELNRQLVEKEKLIKKIEKRLCSINLFTKDELQEHKDAVIDVMEMIEMEDV